MLLMWIGCIGLSCQMLIERYALTYYAGHVNIYIATPTTLGQHSTEYHPILDHSNSFKFDLDNITILQKALVLHRPPNTAWRARLNNRPLPQRSRLGSSKRATVSTFLNILLTQGFRLRVHSCCTR